MEEGRAGGIKGKLGLSSCELGREGSPAGGSAGAAAGGSADDSVLSACVVVVVAVSCREGIFFAVSNVSRLVEG